MEIDMDTAKVCDVGGRERNEDSVTENLTKDGGCFAVADGLGGHTGGDIASACVTEAFAKAYFKYEPRGSDGLRELFSEAQDKLLERADAEGKKGMRTTMAALIIFGNTAVWGHIGDSRLYHFRDGSMVHVTADHSVAYLSYLNGEISYEEIKDSPDQNRLIRCMGTPEKFKPDIAEPISIEAGDAFLLCTDGFWEHISEKEMESSLKKSATASRWLAKMVRTVKKNIKDVPNCDNYSAITIFV